MIYDIDGFCIRLAFQNVAGADVSFGKTRSTGEPGRYDLVYQYEGEQVGRQALPGPVGDDSSTNRSRVLSS